MVCKLQSDILVLIITVYEPKVLKILVGLDFKGFYGTWLILDFQTFKTHANYGVNDF